MFKFYALGVPMLFASLFNFWGKEDLPYKKDEAKMTKVINHSIKQLSERYGVVAVGTGGAIDHGDFKSKREFVAFELRKKISKEEARILIVEIAELMLHNINGTEEIRHYLHDNPFTYRNLEFVVFIHDKENSRIFYPDLGLVSLSQRGTVGFVSYDQKGKFCEYATDVEEPYEEAYKIVAQKEYPKANET